LRILGGLEGPLVADNIYRSSGDARFGHNYPLTPAERAAFFATGPSTEGLCKMTQANKVDPKLLEIWSAR
jgi:hypothetical protein